MSATKARALRRAVERAEKAERLVLVQDAMLGVRNVILQRLQSHLTPEEKEALSR